MPPSPEASPKSSSGDGPNKGAVDECLQKVRDTERSLQTSLHLARTALISLADQHQPEPEKEESVDLKPVQDAKSEEQVNGEHTNGEEEHDQDLFAHKPPEKDKAQAMFNSVDKDNSGKVSIDELRTLMDEMRDKPLSDDDFNNLKCKLCNNDKDADGLLSFEEFYNGFCKPHSHRDSRAKAKEIQKQAMRDLQCERMSPEQHVQIGGVAQSVVTRYLRKELDETGACLQLPWAALIFFFYFFAVTSHFDLDRLHAVDQAISFDIHENANFAFSGIIPFENGRMGHKNIVDVNSIADFWSFFNLGIVPIFWPSGWDVNEARINAITYCQGARKNLQGLGGYDAASLAALSSHWDEVPGECPEKASDEVTFDADTKQFFGNGDNVKMDGTYLLFHRILGGVRMRQERVPLEPCPDRVGLKQPGMCSSTKWSAYWLKPEIQKSLTMELALTDQPGGETQHFLSHWTQDEVRKKLRDLENKAWFSPQTRKIELLFTTYNANEDILTATYVLFFLNRGGHIFKNVEPVSVYLDPYHGMWSPLFYDIAWALLCFKLLAEETWEIVKHWHQLGFRKGTMIYMNLANAIDWISIAFTIFLVNFWILHLGRLGEIKAIISEGNPMTPGSWSSMAKRDEFFLMVDGVVRQTHDLRSALALYPFVIVSRFFKAFSSQPRLAMVTKTFARASVDIFHFGVVFMVVFTIFAFSAMILWGQELEEFANEGRAFHTSFRILLGDFDWEPMTSVGRRIAYLWFWTFVWLVNLIMFNMLLAIIMDVYTDVKSGSADAETLWSQSVEIFYRTRDVYTGKTVPLSAILKALDPTDLDDGDEEENEEEDVILFPSSFADMVPKMTEDQAFQVLLDAQKLKMSDERESDTLSEALVRIQDIDDRTKTLQEHIVQLIQLQQYTLGGGGAPVRRYKRPPPQ